MSFSCANMANASSRYETFDAYTHDLPQERLAPAIELLMYSITVK